MRWLVKNKTISKWKKKNFNWETNDALHPYLTALTSVCRMDHGGKRLGEGVKHSNVHLDLFSLNI